MQPLPTPIRGKGRPDYGPPFLRNFEPSAVWLYSPAEWFVTHFDPARSRTLGCRRGDDQSPDACPLCVRRVPRQESLYAPAAVSKLVATGGFESDKPPSLMHPFQRFILSIPVRAAEKFIGDDIAKRLMAVTGTSSRKMVISFAWSVKPKTLPPAFSLSAALQRHFFPDERAAAKTVPAAKTEPAADDDRPQTLKLPPVDPKKLVNDITGRFGMGGAK